MITYCAKCLNPSTRPNTEIGGDGLCVVCRFEETKGSQDINWSERRRFLKNWIKEALKGQTGPYDCIIPVSGGKDSYRQSFIVRDDLGLKPLLVSSVYPPERGHDRGPENLANLIQHGFDCVTLSLDPKVLRQLTIQSFKRFGNLIKPTEMCLYAIPVHFAIAYKIQLMFFGENPFFTKGENWGNRGGIADNMRAGNTIKGGPKTLGVQNATAQDLHFYTYPDEEAVKKAGIRIAYLGYFFDDWYGRKNADLAIEQGLKTRMEPPEETGDLWGVSALDEDFQIVNRYIMYLKFGFALVTDQVCEVVRQGKITRQEGIKLLEQYDGRCHPRYIENVCQYLKMSEGEFHRSIEPFVNRDLFERTSSGWQPKFKVGEISSRPMRHEAFA